MSFSAAIHATSGDRWLVKNRPIEHFFIIKMIQKMYPIWIILNTFLIEKWFFIQEPLLFLFLTAQRWNTLF